MTTAYALPLVGQDVAVPLLGGGSVPYLNLDFAASAPALVAVAAAVEELLPHYSSVHRGAGWKSKVSSAAYEAARREVALFVGARPDDVVCFTSNTTTALNTLSEALPADCRVVAFASEHHANLLPWHRRRLTVLPAPSSPAEAVAALDDALSALPGAGPVLFAVTAASNVTGEVWPVGALVDVARLHGARTVVDCAQLAPHAPVDLATWDADWLAISGHKLYAPYGAGALVGRRDWLEAGEPWVRGGGAVAFVTHDDVAWAVAPERQEAGSPNVLGAVALGVACRTLREHGMDRIAEHEALLVAHGIERLSQIPGVVRYSLWADEHPKIAVLPFNIGALPYGLVAAALSAEYGIGVRDGCFCAHPLMLHLLQVTAADADRIRADLLCCGHAEVPGAVRMSTGLGTTVGDLDRALDAVESLALHGPVGSYVKDISGHYAPLKDDRVLPALSCLSTTPDS